MTRRERNIYNCGYEAGYAEGYEQGFMRGKIEDVSMELKELNKKFKEQNKNKKNIPIKPLKYDDCEQFIVQCVCGNIMDSRTFTGKCTKCNQLLNVNT